MQTSTKQQQNQIRMIDRIMSSDTEYHIATLNRYYPCFKSKSDNNVKFESIKRCQVTSSSVEDDEVMEEDTSNSIDVAMDEDKPSSPPADNGQIIKPSESASISSKCYRRQRAVSYTDEDLISSPQQQSSQTDRKVSFLDEITQSIISSISYRPTTSHDDKHTLYYNKEDYEMFIYDEYTERLLLEQKEKEEEEEEKVFSWEDLLCYEGEGSDVYCIHMMAEDKEEVEGEGKLMHKVETLKDLHV